MTTPALLSAPERGTDAIGLIARNAVFRAGLNQHHQGFGRSLAQLVLLKHPQHTALARAVQLVAALLVQALEKGQVCIPLAQLAEYGVNQEQWLLLIEHGCAHRPEQSITQELDPALFVLDSLVLADENVDVVYLARQYAYEVRIAQQLCTRAAARIALSQEQQARTVQAQLQVFASTADQEPDWQQVAATNSLLSQLSVITGGPGTGKTSTVFRALALQAACYDKPLCVALAAPTGKAAARLDQAMHEAYERASAGVKALVDQLVLEPAVTVHRLLGLRDQATGATANALTPLPHDIVVVDEASMLDQALMHDLLQAIPAHGKLILLGDARQLSSVEPGRVFADIAGKARSTQLSEPRWAQCVGLMQQQWQMPQLTLVNQASALQDCITVLTRTHRFEVQSAVAALANAILQQDVQQALKVVQTRELLISRRADHASEVMHVVAKFYADYAAQVLQLLEQTTVKQDGSVEEHLTAIQRVWHAFEMQRMLCSNRRGAGSVQELNQVAAQWLKHTLSERTKHVPRARLGQTELFAGLPIMVLQNRPDLRLANGDVGLLLPDAAGRLMAWFEGQAGQGGLSLRAIALPRLPEVEIAFAMTIHKSQGSEFKRVLISLSTPHDATRSIATEHLNRALLYTAVTRAKEQVQLWCEPEVLAQAIMTQPQRMTGLAARLRPT